MTRTFRRTTKDTSARRNVPEKQGGSASYPGRKARGTLCSFCEELATTELPTGKGWDAPVCDGDWCRRRLRKVRGGEK